MSKIGRLHGILLFKSYLILILFHLFLFLSHIGRYFIDYLRIFYNVTKKISIFQICDC